MTHISFMGANLVAQQLGWSMTEGWSQGDDAANAYYAPIETFAARFGEFIELIKSAGFDAVDVWTGQLNWSWATPEHLETARAILEEKGVVATSYAGLFGETVEEFRAACAVASALGARVLGGNAALLFSDRAAALAVLAETGRVLAIENHPEKSPEEILAKIGSDGGGLLGTAVDTGWWGTQGFNAADAIRAFGVHVFHVHLKDIVAAGAHETCLLGEGVVPIEDCIRALAEIHYEGDISIEHEPEHFDPLPDTMMGKSRVLQWQLGVSAER